jgi:hypothetical protein
MSIFQDSGPGGAFMAGRGKILTFNSRNQDSDKLTAASEQEV